MKTYVIRFVLPLIGTTLLGMGQAEARQSHLPNHQRVAQAADDFEQAAEHMHHHLHHILGRAHLTKSARKLIRAARLYRRALEPHAPRRHQRRLFEELAAGFHDFRSQYRYTYLPGSHRTHQALRRLQGSFRDLRRETRHARRHRYQYRSYGGGRKDYPWWPNKGVVVLDDSP